MRQFIYNRHICRATFIQLTMEPSFCGVEDKELLVDLSIPASSPGGNDRRGNEYSTVSYAPSEQNVLQVEKGYPVQDGPADHAGGSVHGGRTSCGVYESRPRRNIDNVFTKQNIAIGILVLMLISATVVICLVVTRASPTSDLQVQRGDIHGESQHLHSIVNTSNTATTIIPRSTVVPSPKRIQCPDVFSRDVRFHPRGSKPEEAMTSSLLDDHDDNTCFSFTPGGADSGDTRDKTEFTMFVQLPRGNQSLELRGFNLNCEESISVAPLVQKLGHGFVRDNPCLLVNISDNDPGDIESCVYNCTCPSDGCREITFTHHSTTQAVDPWRICSVNDRVIPTTCGEYKSAGYTEDGVYAIRLPEGSTPKVADVYCDMTSAKYPFVVMMRRFDGSQNFTLDWDSYSQGFGCLDGEFWIGNDILHALTSEQPLELNVQLRSFADEERRIVYAQFAVGNESENYRLSLGRVIERNLPDEFSSQNGRAFSTYDRENGPSQTNCAGRNKGSWWYTHCGPVQLTGIYGRAVPDGRYRIRWNDWMKNGDMYYPIESVDMKIRSYVLRPEDARDCHAYKQAGYMDNGVYEVNANGRIVEVYCDMNTDGGGWTLLIRRQDGTVDFDLYWSDYKNGFGSMDGEFWLGNDLIHEMTTAGVDQEVRIDLRSFNDEARYIVYNAFYIDDEAHNYRLHVGQKSSGTIQMDRLPYNDNQQFSTRDRDNDQYHCCNCAALKLAPWWHKMCSGLQLTGRYGEHVSDGESRLRWCGWQSVTDCYHPIKYADMKFRPKV